MIERGAFHDAAAPDAGEVYRPVFRLIAVSEGLGGAAGGVLQRLDNIQTGFLPVARYSVYRVNHPTDVCQGFVIQLDFQPVLHHVQEFIHARQRFLIETGLQPIGKSLIELFDGSTGFGSNFYTCCERVVAVIHAVQRILVEAAGGGDLDAADDVFGLVQNSWDVSGAASGKQDNLG